MSDILRRSVFATLDKLELPDSVVKIQRPETWSKPWSLSKKDLALLLQDFFRGAAGSRTEAEACFEYIVDRKKRELVSKEFSFTRVLNVSDNGADTAGSD